MVPNSHSSKSLWGFGCLELAKELKYDGDTSDSAKMNIWLHKQVMTKLAANGGKLPDDLKN